MWQLVESGNVDKVNESLDADENINLVEEESGDTLLIRAIHNDQDVMLEYLISRVSSNIINHENKAGDTAMSLIVSKDNLHMAEILCTRSVNITMGMRKIASTEMREFIDQYRKDIMLIEAAQDCNKGIVQSLISVGGNPDRTIDECTAAEFMTSIYSSAEEEEEEEEEEQEDVQHEGRWYLSQRGNRLCGLYAVRHILNQKDIPREAMDNIAVELAGYVARDAESKRFEVNQHAHYDGNYSADVLMSYLEAQGYTSTRSRKVDHTNAEEDMKDPQMIGYIRNLGNYHWIGYRKLPHEIWEECDSLDCYPFPCMKSPDLAEKSMTDVISVYKPTGELPTWIENTTRVRQLLWYLRNPYES